MEVDDIQTHQACKFSRVANGSKLDSSKLIHNHQHRHHLYPYDDDSHQNHQPPHSTSRGITTTDNNTSTHINGLASAAEMGSTAAAGAPDETGGGNGGGNSNHFRHWQHSNRIIRVSRASGGKDRHSKVWTAKGARDRRVRLSVTTAIQFYDLQDRLGFDQPSKAVEWLIKAASGAIAELPSLNAHFGTTDHHLPPGPGSALAAALGTDVNDRRQLTADNSNNDNIGRGGCIDSADAELDDDDDDDDSTQLEPETHNFRPHHHQGSLRSKSACSSTSETSKGSGLSLSQSRSQIRVKARERARERAAKDKEKENEPRVVNNVNVNVNPLSHGGSSFTQLLTAGIGMGNVDSTAAVTCSSPSAAAHHGSNGRQWPITSSAPMAMDYFNMLAMASSPSSSSSRGGGGGGGGGGSVNNNNNNGSNSNNNGNPNHSSPGFPRQIQLGNSMSQTMMVSPFSVAAGDHHHSELHQFPFVSDHLVQNTAAATGNDYNLNFSISPSGLAGFNRGTLQSNSPSQYTHLQRFSALDGTSLPFFLGAAAVSSAENQHNHQNHQHHQQQFPPGLQLCYGDGGRQPSDQKGKGKN